jgi:hypothetical protein
MTLHTLVIIFVCLGVATAIGLIVLVFAIFSLILSEEPTPELMAQRTLRVTCINCTCPALCTIYGHCEKREPQAFEDEIRRRFDSECS